MSKGSSGSLAVSSFGFARSGVPVVEAVCAVARRMWPNKTARHLAARAGVTHRSCEFWLQQQTGMGAEALAEILRSDVGLQVLDEIMGDVKPRWWPSFRQAVQIEQIAARNEATRREIEALRKTIG